MLDFITINTHSSIRIDEGIIIYCDPFKIKEEKHDADIILITHSHYDHYSPDDIQKVMKADTVIICPKSVMATDGSGLEVIRVSASDSIEVKGISI